MTPDTAPSVPDQRLRPSRRTLVRAGVWSTPIIAVGTAAPAFALSPCAPVVFATPPWTATTTGNNSGAGNGFTSYGTAGTTRYLSIADNGSTGLETTAANNSTVSLQTTLNLAAGKTYNFRFTVASGFSSNTLNNSQLQKLDIVFNTVALGKYTTNVSSSSASLTTGYTVLNTTNGGVTTQTIDIPFTTGAAVTTVTLQYLWTLPARGYNPVLGLPTATYTGSADIAVSAPVISGTGC